MWLVKSHLFWIAPWSWLSGFSSYFCGQFTRLLWDWFPSQRPSGHDTRVLSKYSSENCPMPYFMSILYHDQTSGLSTSGHWSRWRGLAWNILVSITFLILRHWTNYLADKHCTCTAHAYHLSTLTRPYKTKLNKLKFTEENEKTQPVRELAR